VRRLVAAVVACALLLPVAAAHADGDPASDVLIYARVFWPYDVKYPAKSATALNSTIVEAGRKGYKIRVALIQNQFDLGSAGLLYKHPQEYSKFLAQELAQFNTDWVLTVMPNGYGIYHCKGIRRPEGYVDPCEKEEPSAADQKLLRSLAPPKQDLAAGGAEAVRKLAALHGVSVGTSKLPFILGGVGAVIVALGAFFVVVRRRRARV
jgi:hypothetical protein